MSECRVQLRRDAVNTAWGFRLQGGHEYDSPLVVQRVSRPKLSHIGRIGNVLMYSDVQLLYFCAMSFTLTFCSIAKIFSA